VLNTNAQIDEQKFSTRATSAAETEAELGSFHLWIHDLTVARNLTDQALKDDPKLGLAHENMGFLDFADGKDAEAASEFTQAVSLDGSLYLSLFYKTMLSPLPTSSSVADMNAFGAAMGKVLQLNPDFAPAYVQLARLALRENDLVSALAVARKAEELEPSRAGYHVLTGQILLRMGKGADAADSARYVAERWFGADHDEAVELWNSVPAAQRSGDPIAETPVRDTQTAAGKIKSIVCGDQDHGLTLVLDHDGQPQTFHSKRGFETGHSDTLWYGGDHFTLCHHLEGLRAVVRYRASTDSAYAGDVAEVEIRDDLPQPLKQAMAAAAP
jgi:hypothetical protein